VLLGVLFVEPLLDEEFLTEVLVRLLDQVLKKARLAEPALLTSEASAQRPQVAELQAVESGAEDELPDGLLDLVRLHIGAEQQSIFSDVFTAQAGDAFSRKGIVA
jgi:hypothetical protein